MYILVLLLMLCFNPRTYIRYDYDGLKNAPINSVFQSTYLYKVRRSSRIKQHIDHGVSIHVPI